MKQIGNINQSSAISPATRQAVAKMLAAAVAPFGGEVQELPGVNDRLRFSRPGSPAKDILLIQEPLTSTAGKGQETVSVLRGAPSYRREDLRLKGHNFVDIGKGAVRFASQGLMIDRTDLRKTAGRTGKGEHRTPFSDRASIVARVLLSRLGQTCRLSELAVQSEVSLALASKVVGRLAEEDLVDAVKKGRELYVTLRDPWPLFLRWVGEYRWSDNPALTVAAPVGAMQRFLPRIDEQFSSLPNRPRWALTLQAAAAQSALKSNSDAVHLYIDCRGRPELSHLASELKWEPSPQGKVTLLAPRYRRATWWRLQEPHGLPVVHEIQLLLDLWHYPVRGREQAEYLSRRLGWPPLPA